MSSSPSNLGHTHPVAVLHMGGDLSQRDIRYLLHQPQYLIAMRLDLMGALIAATRTGLNAARLPPLPNPFDGRRRRNPEAPVPARMLNQITFDLGIRNDSKQWENALNR